MSAELASNRMLNRDFTQLAWSPQIAEDLRRIVRLAVFEDLDRGQDWTTICLVPEEATASANIVARKPGVIAGTKARIYDTRKTIPGWRRLDKYAVHCGGGHNHRTGLYDAILIKDNHLALGRDEAAIAHFSPAEAVRKAKAFLAQQEHGEIPRGAPDSDMIVEVEVDSLAQLREVLPERPDIVLLDN